MPLTRDQCSLQGGSISTVALERAGEMCGGDGIIRLTEEHKTQVLADLWAVTDCIEHQVGIMMMLSGQSSTCDSSAMA